MLILSNENCKKLNKIALKKCPNLVRQQSRAQCVAQRQTRGPKGELDRQ
jgi:hypothetical protein